MNMIIAIPLLPVPEFAMPQRRAKGAIHAVNTFLHVHPDVQYSLLEVNQDYFTSGVTHEW